MKRKIQFIGPVLTASGYGVHARQLLRAVVDTGLYDVRVEPIKWGETPILHDPSVDWIRSIQGTHSEPEVAIEVTIPNEFKRRAPLTIGVTAGIEVDRVSHQWLLRCNQEVDVVVVPSEHSRTAFMVEYQAEDGSKLRLDKPIFVIPEGIDTAVYAHRAPARTSLDIPERCFVFVGLGLDKPHGADRKNVTRLVEYFCRAFAGSQSVGLVLKTSIVNYSTVDFEIVKRRVAEIKASTGCGEFPRISILHGRLSEEQLAGLYNDPRVIASVSITHGEGFGLPLIEAAACGLPVMATNWSGHLDFLRRDGQRLFVPFDYDLQQIPQECVWEGVMDAGTNWAVPREADVSMKLQKMALNSDTPRRWASELAEHISQRYSLAAVGAEFCDLLARGVSQLAGAAPKTRGAFVTDQRARVLAKGPSLIYTMPMSAGDVFLSTGVVAALRRKHPGHRVYFATSPQYFDIVRDLRIDDAGGFAEGIPLIDELIEWQTWMQDVSILEDVFDEVYTPNLAVQMTWSNWVHRGRGRNLIDEFASQCRVEARVPLFPKGRQLRGAKPVPEGKWVAVHSGGQKSARRWTGWSGLVANLRANGVKVIQVGASDDVPVGTVDLDARGRSHTELVSILDDVGTLVCIDSYPMHVANAIGCRIIAIFGSSYPGSTGPRNFGSHDRGVLGLRLIETPDRNGCERACYKDACAVDADNPCINNITAERVFLEAASSLGLERYDFKEYRPRIAGYTHILNPKTHGYPYAQSIISMLGFCDEVIVVDGGSTDGSVKDLDGHPVIEAALYSKRLKVITREWDPEEPGMDGMQKAFGRAMVSPDIEFLWQQDADEVVHERDYTRIVELCRRFPTDVDVVHLPVVELWGDDRRARTDRHSWKWRLSRNNIRITHGIAAQARQIDPKTGRIFARRGMSDGCELIDMVTGEHVKHRGFYSKDLEALRTGDPSRYGDTMNGLYEKLPSVWHYSWADLPRKIRNFRDFWDGQWQVLYQGQSEPRFPDVVTDEDVARKAEELRERGGEHGKAVTFELRLAPPACMKGWKDA